METKFEKHILTTAVPFSKMEELVKRVTAERHYTIQTYLEWCNVKNDSKYDKKTLQNYANNVNTGRASMINTLMLLKQCAEDIAHELLEMNKISVD